MFHFLKPVSDGAFTLDVSGFAAHLARLGLVTTSGVFGAGKSTFLRALAMWMKILGAVFRVDNRLVHTTRGMHCSDPSVASEDAVDAVAFIDAQGERRNWVGGGVTPLGSVYPYCLFCFFYPQAKTSARPRKT
jgi:hypothetical protein